MVARTHVAQFMTIPSVKASSAEVLTTFSAELRDCIAALESCNVKLQSDTDLDRILATIPTDLGEKCGRKCDKLDRRLTLIDFDIWLEMQNAKGRAFGVLHCELSSNRKGDRNELIGLRGRSDKMVGQRRINVTALQSA